MPLGGVEDAALAQRLAVGEQDVLDERRAGLGGTDVQEYASGHVCPSCSCQARRLAVDGQLEGAVAVDRSRGAGGLPAAGRPDRRAQRSQRS